MRPAKVFLANSGTEAVEGAIKLARHSTGRPNVIAFFGAFHGRSLGSLSLTASKAHYRGGFGIVMAGSFHAPFAGQAELDGAAYIEQVLFKRLTEPNDVAAIFVEPIQGEGGYIVPPAGWLADLRDLCDRHGILLVMDEVQSGIGRTGNDVGVRARRRRARRDLRRQGPRQRAAAGGTDRQGRHHGLAARASTARRSAATRSPAPPRSPRSISSKAGWPPTRRPWATISSPGSAPCRRSTR